MTRTVPIMCAAAAVLLVSACSDRDKGAGSDVVAERSATVGARPSTAAKKSRSSGSVRPARVFTPPPKVARRPYIRRTKAEGLRALPDGDLKEWDGADVGWINLDKAINGAAGWSGPEDLSAQLAIASYVSGLSIGLTVTDDVHRSAGFDAALATSDHVDLELVPWGPRAGTASGKKLVGLRFKLGSNRRLVRMIKPASTSRAEAISVTGVRQPEGYRLELKLPLSAMVPLPAGEISTLRYRITLFDSDAKGETAVATLRFAGELRLDPPLRVPEAVRKRGSVRICMAGEKNALFSYWHGWRCAVPYRRKMIQQNDVSIEPPLTLGHARVPTPPRLVWIRERVLFVNIPGANRALVGLLDEKDTLLSVMRLGVVGAVDPGNPLMREADVEHFKLPDGTWAVAVVHAYPDRVSPFAGRCAGGHRVMLSVVALRECYTSSPHKPAPPPAKPPRLEEILRIPLEACHRADAWDWSISDDRRTISVRSSIFPARKPTLYRYVDGRYVRVVHGKAPRGN